MIFQTRRDPMLRKADDDDSEMSAESATSDSGRGGSEEDINSNRGNPMSDSGTLPRKQNFVTYSFHFHSAMMEAY
jgi:hypothetical protein